MTEQTNTLPAAAAVDVEGRVFRELDGRRIGLGEESWIAQVFGVHSRSGEAWVQITPHNELRSSVVVHMCPDTTPGQVALALTRWGQTPPTERPALIEATPIKAH